MEMTCKSITMPTGSTILKSNRVLSGLGTKSATVQFRLQAPMSANTVDDSSYFLVLGSAVSGSAMDNPDHVYAFHDDFSSSVLKKEWMTNNFVNGACKKGDCLETLSREASKTKKRSEFM